MKQYKVQTHLLGRYRENEEIPKSVKDDLVDSGCPDWWFSPVEEEVKAGQYWGLENGHIVRVLSDSTYSRYTLSRIDTDYKWDFNWEKSVILADGKLLDDDTVEEHLIAEAKRRGLVKEGIEIKWDHRKDATNVIGKFDEVRYEEHSDLLVVNDRMGTFLYMEGKWPKIVDEPIQINGHEITVEKEHLKIDCGDTINKNAFIGFHNIVDKYGLDVERDGENINIQIDKIWKQL